ncbi:hypothetical protein HGB24_02665 [Candidatus Saccharibacteria bacterium]|nr:hypothetical protein [Candidatus Saccharibacteria bacterium]
MPNDVNLKSNKLAVFIILATITTGFSLIRTGFGPFFYIFMAMWAGVYLISFSKSRPRTREQFTAIILLAFFVAMLLSFRILAIYNK